MAIIKINGVEMPNPSSFKWNKSDLDSDNSKRNAAGLMLRDKITSKVKLNLEWKALSPKDISKLLTAVDSTFFQVSYPDAQSGGYTTKTFYVGDRSAPIYTVKNGVPLWEGLTMNFTEQ